MSREGEPVREATMRVEADGSFSGVLSAPTSSGRYLVEITGTALRAPGDVAPRTLLWVPIYVGIPEPQTPDELMLRPEPNPGPAGVWPTWVLATYNAERARLGRAPLRLDENLSAAASARASKLGQHDAPWLAEIMGPRADSHVETTLLAAAQPARRAYGWRSAFELLADAVYMQMLRPTARLALFESGASRLGIGIAPRASTDGIVEYQLVEYLGP